MTALEFLGVTTLWIFGTAVATFIVTGLAAYATRHDGMASLAVISAAAIGTLGLGVVSWVAWLIYLVIRYV